MHRGLWPNVDMSPLYSLYQVSYGNYKAKESSKNYNLGQKTSKFGQNFGSRTWANDISRLSQDL